MVAVELSHAVWPKVAAFLGWTDRYSLLALNSDVVDSPLRRQFFAQSAWRVPPTAPHADRVVLRLTVKRSIRRVKINSTWQQTYLSEFPELEHVVIDTKAEDEVDGVEEGEDETGDGSFVLSSCIPTTVKRLTLKTIGDVPSLGALAHLVNLEEFVLDANQVFNGSALLSLPKLELLSLSLTYDADAEDYAFVSRLRHLRTLFLKIPWVNTGTFPVLSPLEDVTVLYGTGTLSADPLLLVAPKLKRAKFSDFSFDCAVERPPAVAMMATLANIQELYLKRMHFGSEYPHELAVLSRLTTLKKLILTDEEDAPSLAPLSVLTELEELQVCARPDADWSPLLSLKKLQYLNQRGDATKWNESSMRTLLQLPLLATLLGATKLSSRFPLPQVKKMELLNQDFHAVLDFDPGCCVNVTDLTVSGTVDLASLVQCFPNVEGLKIALHQSDVRVGPSPLKSLTHLKHLSVLVDSSNHHELAFLAEMTSIQSLELSSISDLSLLRSMSELRELTLHNVPSKDISILAELTQLRKLTVTPDRGDVRTVACLRSHPSLMELRLYDKAKYRKLMDANGKCLMPNLKEIWLWRWLGWKRVY